MNKLVGTYQFMKLWQSVFFQACNFDRDQKRKKSSDNRKTTQAFDAPATVIKSNINVVQFFYKL